MARDTHLKGVRDVGHYVSQNVAVGAHTQLVRHPEVVGVVSFVVLDEETVGAVLSLEEPVPGDPDSGEADLKISC